MEHILFAAIKIGAKTYALPRPNRHHNVINSLIEAKLFKAPITGEQGFVTNKGRFVDRIEGLQIATDANQILEKHGNEGQLFSEDMW
jgi:hypothetical protein